MVISRALLAATLILGAAGVTASGPAAAAGACAEPTIAGSDRSETLRGTDGPDVIDGRGGDDRILGLAGDDVLCGGIGQDVLLGGPGDDALHGGADAKVVEDTDYYVYYGDHLDGGRGDDRLDPGADPRHEGSVDAVTYLRSPGPVVVDLAAGTATGYGSDLITGPLDSVHGSRYDDVLLGSAGPEVLDGEGGSDHVDGRGGDDWVDGGGTPEEPEHTANTILGGAGDDVVNANDGDDLLRGGPGNDLVQAGGGQLVDGGPGRDDYPELAFYDDHHRFQWHADGTIDLAAGTTAVRFPDFTVELPTPGFENASSPRGGRWTVRGTDGANELSAGFFHTPVRLFGLGGDYVLYGSDEDDLLDGGPGTDKGIGWGGEDRLVSIERGRD
jgi:Ca2+-binding RTX toxin-like protein